MKVIGLNYILDSSSYNLIKSLITGPFNQGYIKCLLLHCGQQYLAAQKDYSPNKLTFQQIFLTLLVISSH